jgi:hypothetical protein
MTTLENALLHRASYVTNSKIVNLEPHTAVLPVLAHESLWIDSEHIPTQAQNHIKPLLASPTDGLDVENEDMLFDKNGYITDSGYVQKIVRLPLTHGDFGELTNSNLKTAVHPRYASDGLYRPVLEKCPIGGNGIYELVSDHLWQFDTLSGVVTARAAEFSKSYTYVISYFQYVGRVGIPQGVKDANTDDVKEGVINKYMNRELFDSWLSDSTNVVLSVNSSAVISSDDIIEGVANHFFTKERFDTEMLSRSLDDIPDGQVRQSITETNLKNLNKALGSVTNLHLNTLLQPPEDTTNTLYVERIDNEDKLMFNSLPVGSGIQSSSAVVTSNSHENVVEDTLGNYHGTFTGKTGGLHTGDVIGNVSGFVSRIDNHRIISAKLLGNGEGNWTGTVNGDVVGSFEGHAKIITGSIDNAYHVTIGTYDASSLLHISGNEDHIQLTNSDHNTSSIIKCNSVGSLLISASSLISDNFECNSLECFGIIKASDIQAEHLTCIGIDNNFYGMFDVGVIEGATDITASNINTQSLKSSDVNASTLSCNTLNLGLGGLLGSEISCSTVTCSELSVNTFHIDNLQFDAANVFDNPNVQLNSISASAITTSGMSTNQISADEIVTSQLSVSSIVGVDFISSLAVSQLTLSLGNYIDERITQLSLAIPSISVGSASMISCSELFANEIDANVLKVSTLSVNTIHGITLTTDLSISGVTQNISVSELTTDTLSCATLMFDTLKRTSPAYSSSANPAMMTSASTADVSFMSDDSHFFGDMVVQGSLFVTDTIFIGIEPSLNIENVNSLTASFISVGTLQVDMITGLTGGINSGTNLIDNFFNEGDTLHQGNMQVDGNLIVTGMLLTGAYNSLNEFAFDGGLSVSNDVYIEDSSSSISVKSAILELRQRLEALENVIAVLPPLEDVSLS